MSGLPGSGKDTWLGRSRGDLPTVSLDEIRSELEIDPTDDQGKVAQLAKERCREFLRAGTPFESLLRQNKARSKAVPEPGDPQIGRQVRAADVDGMPRSDCQRRMTNMVGKIQRSVFDYY